MNIPITDPLSYLGVLFLIAGLFLLLAGMRILKVEKITVEPGRNTIIFGVIVAIAGVAILAMSAQNTLVEAPAAVSPRPTEITPASVLPTQTRTLNTPTQQTAATTASPTPEPQIFEVHLEQKNQCNVKINGFVNFGDGHQMQWDWGDHSQSIGLFPQEHAYKQSGAYTLTITTTTGISKSLPITCEKMAVYPTLESPAKVLVDTYHADTGLNAQQRNILKAQGFQFEWADRPFTLDYLKSYDIVIIDFPFYLEGKQRFTQDELTVVREYIQNGGSVLVLALGWYWVQHNEVIEDFPLNSITQPFGITYTGESVWNLVNDQSPTFYAPFLNAEHPITNGIQKIGLKGGVSGLLIVQPPAVALLWGDDNTESAYHVKNPAIMAAVMIGKGKLVCIQNGQFMLGFSEEYDNEQLTINTFQWLASKE